MATGPTPPDDYDSPWKEVSGRFFPQLVEFFAPDLYAIIDWSAGYEFLEQELREMLRDAETGPRRSPRVALLPKEMTKSFRQRIEEFEQESIMKYRTSLERLERQEGRQEGLREVILTLFEEKFGPPDASILQRIEKASRDQILLWAKSILTASSQDEIFAT